LKSYGLKTIKHILFRYSTFLWALLKPLGAWGVFLISAVDAAFLGLPMDPVVATYVYQNRGRFLLYVFLASAGSALGSIVIYLIGYKGGEELLRKRISPERFEKFHKAFDKHPFWSLMFPAMLPPPTPFKIFALAAAVAEMSIWHFLGAIFLGRTVRFLVLAILVIKFGPGVVHRLRIFFTEHYYWVLIVAGTVMAVWLLLRRTRKRPASEVLS